MTPQQLETHLQPLVPGLVRVYEMDREVPADCHNFDDCCGQPVVLTGGELLINACTTCLDRVLAHEFGEYIDSPAPLEVDVEIFRAALVLAAAA